MEPPFINHNNRMNSIRAKYISQGILIAIEESNRELVSFKNELNDVGERSSNTIKNIWKDTTNTVSNLENLDEEMRRSSLLPTPKKPMLSSIIISLMALALTSCASEFFY
jgi:hypothetical protein